MRRMIVWGVILAVAVIAAILVSQAVGPKSNAPPRGMVVYAGERTFTPEEFANFKKFVGSNQDIRLNHIGVTNNSTTPFTVKFEIMIPEGAKCPYGDLVGKVSRPVNVKTVAVGVGVFVVIVVLGAWIVNIPQIGGVRWGRH